MKERIRRFQTEKIHHYMVSRQKKLINPISLIFRRVEFIGRMHFAPIFILLIVSFSFLYSCSVSYSLQGGKINYDLVKTITIHDFPNRATLVFPTLAQTFDRALRDRFIEQTRLVAVPNNGDIEISGEITGYDIQGMAVKEDAYASRARLTITIRVKYENNKEPDSDVDRSFSASREFDSGQTLDASVQENLNREIIDEIIDLIYNATVANW